ncbi:hypothetical protein SUGI_0829890 [Cryptomeria japonica]|nr:hypothetical protein SUGI_0829890 [Cryptomeria japonica]
MTAPSVEVPPPLLDPTLESTVGVHVVVPATGSPRSANHTEENASLHTPSTSPVLTDTGLKGEERNIPQPRPKTSADQADVDLVKENPKSSWKNALLGSTKSTPEDVVATFSQTEDGTKIKLPDNLMDIIASSLHLAIVGHFFSFRPFIDMVRRWAKCHWKLKGSLEVSAIPGGLFLFKFNTEEDLIYVLLGSWAETSKSLNPGDGKLTTKDYFFTAFVILVVKIFDL